MKQQIANLVDVCSFYYTKKKKIQFIVAKDEIVNIINEILNNPKLISEALKEPFTINSQDKVK